MNSPPSPRPLRCIKRKQTKMETVYAFPWTFFSSHLSFSWLVSDFLFLCYPPSPANCYSKFTHTCYSITPTPASFATLIPHPHPHLTLTTPYTHHTFALQSVSFLLLVFVKASTTYKIDLVLVYTHVYGVECAVCRI